MSPGQALSLKDGDVCDREASSSEGDHSPAIEGSPISPGDDTLDSKQEKDVNITATRMANEAGSESTSGEQALTNGRLWKTTFLRYGPLAGIGCMLLAIASLVISLGVLIGSDRAPVAEWGATPSAILAICTAVANQALRFAAFQGFAVAWWFNASRGTSVRKLQANWRAGTTFMGALVAGRDMGLIGLACILSTLVAVDGPLLQKATMVVTAPITNQPIPLNISMSPEIPRGYTGGWLLSNASEYTQAFSFNRTIPTANGPVLNNVIPYWKGGITSTSYVKAWFQDEVVSGVVKGCDGMCKVTVTAPAVTQSTCTSREILVNYTRWDGSLMAGVVPPLSQNGFLISGDLLLDDREHINMITAYSTIHDCAGTLYFKACTLDAALGEYEVTVDHGKLTLSEEGPRIIAIANNTHTNRTWDKNQGWYPSTLAGIASHFYERYMTDVAWYEYESGMGSAARGNGPQEIYGIASDETCRSFRDPTKDMVLKLNEFMFDVGAVAAQEDPSFLESSLDSGLLIHQTVTGQRIGNHNVFHTNLRWFAAAAAVEAFCIALILPTYIGFWRLGRPVSFSPLEIAKAFEAPSFSNCNSNSSGNDIAHVLGDAEVRYGATRTLQGETKLAFANSKLVGYPAKKSRFDK